MKFTGYLYSAGRYDSSKEVPTHYADIGTFHPILRHLAEESSEKRPHWVCSNLMCGLSLHKGSVSISPACMNQMPIDPSCKERISP